MTTSLIAQIPHLRDGRVPRDVAGSCTCGRVHGLRIAASFSAAAPFRWPIANSVDFMHLVYFREFISPSRSPLASCASALLNTTAHTVSSAIDGHGRIVRQLTAGSLPHLISFFSSSVSALSSSHHSPPERNHPFLRAGLMSAISSLATPLRNSFGVILQRPPQMSVAEVEFLLRTFMHPDSPTVTISSFAAAVLYSSGLVVPRARAVPFSAARSLANACCSAVSPVLMPMLMISPSSVLTVAMIPGYFKTVSEDSLTRQVQPRWRPPPRRVSRASSQACPPSHRFQGVQAALLNAVPGRLLLAVAAPAALSAMSVIVASHARSAASPSRRAARAWASVVPRPRSRTSTTLMLMAISTNSIAKTSMTTFDIRSIFVFTLA